MASYLVVVYGPPLSGKTTVAWEIASALPGKTAVVSVDQLLGGSIAIPDEDARAELEMVHTQLRLLVANTLKNRYHVVVEGPFYFERGGVWHNFEAEIDQLVALMRQMTEKALVVRLIASDEELARRAGAAGREGELEEARVMATKYKARYGERFRSFDSGKTSKAEIVAAVVQALH